MSSIINPIATVLGKILDILFTGLNAIGIGNIAIAIVLFTLIVKLLMLPLTLKQSKLTKFNSVITPEVKRIQEKYKGKERDPNVAAKMQEEIKGVYEKYGVSQFGGCVQLLIQFPILLALYRVFQRIPMYVGSMKSCFMNFLGTSGGMKGIMNESNYIDVMNNIPNYKSVIGNVDWTNVNDAIVAINSFTGEQWEYLKTSFGDYANIITNNQQMINSMNTTFLGINMSQVPVLGLNISIIIPILSGIANYVSAKIMQGKQQIDEDNPAAASMKMMTMFMPIMSLFIAFTVPAGLGIYWIATAVISTIIQLLVNRHYDKIGIDALVEANLEKRKKKLAKQGINSEKLIKNATVSSKSNAVDRKIESVDKNKQRIQQLQEKKDNNDKKVKEILSKAKDNSGQKKSLADRVNKVSQLDKDKR